jgi:hypothetical protein
MPADILKDIFIDENGDIAIGANGDLKPVRDADVVVQEVALQSTPVLTRAHAGR